MRLTKKFCDHSLHTHTHTHSDVCHVSSMTQRRKASLGLQLSWRSSANSCVCMCVCCHSLRKERSWFEVLGQGTSWHVAAYVSSRSLHFCLLIALLHCWLQVAAVVVSAVYLLLVRLVGFPLHCGCCCCSRCCLVLFFYVCKAEAKLCVECL